MMPADRSPGAESALTWKAGLDAPRRFSPAPAAGNVVRFGPFAVLALDVHLLVVAMFLVDSPWRPLAVGTLSALIFFTIAVITIVRRRG
jgi:hypothetical protein